MTIAEKLTKIEENVPKVYEAGVKTGKKAEYDALWDMIQDNGNPTDYARAFCGQWRNIEIFKPKYDIIATNAYMIFANFPQKIDLEAYLQSLGIKLDISRADNTNYLFQGANITRVGVIDVRNSAGSCPLDNAFANCPNLVTIDKLYIKTGIRANSKEFGGTFNNCKALENLTIVGEITDNGLNLNTSPKLTRASLLNIINCLKDYSGTGETRTATLGTTNLAKLTDAEKAIATEKGWTLE